MLNKCKNGKASSPADDILNKYLKCTKHIMLPIYKSLFNLILDTGVIPECWSMGFILPIFKGKGSHTEPNNYRPITILSCLGKLFTSVLNERLVQFNSLQNIINENQAGFRKSYSTLDHVFTLSFLQNLFKSQKRETICRIRRFFTLF